MKNPLRSGSIAFTCLISVALLHMPMASAQGQSTAKTQETSVAPQSKPAPPRTPASLGFRSSFEHYKPYRDEKPGAWKASNDEVGRIGGWRAYLKEANEPDAPAAPSRAPSSLPPQAPPPARSPLPHAGHGSK
jgi:hypothetical protein